MALKTFTFNEKKSSQYGLYVLSSTSYNAAEKNATGIEIIGRNGDVINDYSNFKNIIVSYEVLLTPVSGELATRTRSINRLLYENDNRNRVTGNSTKTKYVKLTDDYNPDFYRLAYFVGPVDWETMINKYGKATLNFVCQPQKYYINYYTETTREISNGQTLTIYPDNRSGAPISVSDNRYFPLITITPSEDTLDTGTIAITGAGSTLTITPGVLVPYAPNPLQIDCYEEQAIYSGSLLNNKISFQYGSYDYQWPMITTANNYLRITNNLGVTATVKIDWRIWTL